jgi:hypothetical protein
VSRTQLFAIRNGVVVLTTQQAHQRGPSGQQSGLQFGSEPSATIPRRDPCQLRDCLCGRQRDAPAGSNPANGMMRSAIVTLGGPIEKIRVESFFAMMYFHLVIP